MRNYVQPGQRIDCVAPAGGVTAGQPILVEDVFGVATLPADAGSRYVLDVGPSVCTLPKDPSVAFLAKQNAYFSANEGWVTSSGHPIGFATEAAGVGEEFVRVRFGVQLGMAVAAAASDTDMCDADGDTCFEVERTPDDDVLRGKANGVDVFTFTDTTGFIIHDDGAFKRHISTDNSPNAIEILASDVPVTGQAKVSVQHDGNPSVGWTAQVAGGVGSSFDGDENTMTLRVADAGPAKVETFKGDIPGPLPLGYGNVTQVVTPTIKTALAYMADLGSGDDLLNCLVVQDHETAPTIRTIVNLQTTGWRADILTQNFVSGGSGGIGVSETGINLDIVEPSGPTTNHMDMLPTSGTWVLTGDDGGTSRFNLASSPPLSDYRTDLGPAKGQVLCQSPTSSTASAEMHAADGVTTGILRVHHDANIETPTMPGPFANDGLAAAGGVMFMGLYYDAGGVVRIRLV